MGLLSLGTPLDWADSKKFNDHVRTNGILQLINIFNQSASRDDDPFLWGDEVEYMLVDLNNDEKTATLSIDHDFILDNLNDSSKSFEKCLDNNISFHPEYGRFMLEATPLKPYDGESLDDFVYVEENMARRRYVAKTELPNNIVPLTFTTFPRMGTPNFTSPPAKPNGPASQSLFLPDEIINRHVRFPTLTANIRNRRGSKVAINLPIYPDLNTKLLDDSIPERSLFKSDQEPWLGASKPGFVYMDSMGFGMGCSCLQVTMQAKNIDQSRYLYDALAPLTPIMLSASAAAPIFKGFLVNQDVRWNVISGAVDDRTFAERGVKPYEGYNLFGGLDLEQSSVSRDVDEIEKINEFGDSVYKTKDGKPVQVLPKSRYESIDNYLGDIQPDATFDFFKPTYNDIYSPINSKVYENLKQQDNFDELMAKHFAHLFVRDPLVLFNERIDQQNNEENDHFENIQSTNWQTLRFKPPAPISSNECLASAKHRPGWRVEFRPMEIQITDFENAAYSNFISLVSRAILKFHPNFYIPISKIDYNMETAHKVDSILKEKFWWKHDCGLLKSDFKDYDLSWFDRKIDEIKSGKEASIKLNGTAANGISNGSGESESNETQMTVDEILNGNSQFPGLISMIIRFIAIEFSNATESQLLRLQAYLKLISYRASGKIPTIAHYLRSFVLNHSTYQRDSKINNTINYDISYNFNQISNYNKDYLIKLFGEELSEYLSKNANKCFDK